MHFLFISLHKVFNYFYTFSIVSEISKASIYLDEDSFKEVELYFKKNNNKTIENDGFYVYDPKLHEQIIDIIVTIGGDGTILWASNLFQKRAVPPILGFYKGTLGFMCNYEVLEMNEVLTKVLSDMKNKRNLFVEQKMRLQGKIKRDEKSDNDSLLEDDIVFHSLNEIIIDRGHSPYFIILNIYLGEKKFTVTSGDGIIFATPTGSTAYALSAGGPIVHNYVTSILMIPISAQSLSFRPILIPVEVEIIVEVAPVCKINEVNVSSDGRNRHFLKKGEQLLISKSGFGSTR